MMKNGFFKGSADCADHCITGRSVKQGACPKSLLSTAFEKTACRSVGGGAWCLALAFNRSKTLMRASAGMSIL
ncbi:MAG: hypothetical protein LBE61_12695 [Burkholderiaceae bacterium]|jgi:hypothetical protein|nr:hypothetical protein [Burkholderiaceae bacterium]